MNPTVRLRVMTFNIRFHNPQDGACSWPFRRDLVIRTVLRRRPDLLATQEAMPEQLAFLSKRLTGYVPCLPSRVADPDPYVQMPTVFFRAGSLSKRGCGEFWLSETPEVHRSKSWGAAFPRLFTYGCFHHEPTGRRIWFGNTHLDHVSQEARVRGARLIRGWIRRRRLPVILAGDFNEEPDGPVHGILAGPSGPLVDSWREIPGRQGREPSTSHHFTGVGSGGRIDWILASPEIRVEEACIVKEEESGLFPSDHFPYLATLRL